jgi:hypothetical protein
MTRGGARAGAGRKSALSGYEALQVGERFEYLRIMAAEDQAMSRQHAGKLIEAAQERANSIPLKERKRGMPEDITDDVDFYTGSTPDASRRAMSLPVKRQYGAKAEIAKAAIAWCQDEYGQIITTSKAVECWKKYKRFQKWAENQDSLNFT